MVELYELAVGAGVSEPPVGYINIGAACGVEQDPLYNLIAQRRLVGIAVEQREEVFDQLNQNVGSTNSDTRTLNEWATLSNIQ